MPTFKVRDLMIHVMPAAGAAQQAGAGPQICNPLGVTIANCTLGSHITCLTGITGCNFACSHLAITNCLTGVTQVCTFNTCHTGCTISFQCQFACSFVSPVGPTCTCSFASPVEGGTIFEDPEILAGMREQLRQQLQAVQQQEQAVTTKLAPQTLDDVKMLEDQLKAALEELAQRRTELQGKQ